MKNAGSGTVGVQTRMGIKKPLDLQGVWWRSGWDSNPRGVAAKLISSQPRYDRFDTAPGRKHYNTRIFEMQGKKKKAVKFEKDSPTTDRTTDQKYLLSEPQH